MDEQVASADRKKRRVDRVSLVDNAEKGKGAQSITDELANISVCRQKSVEEYKTEAALLFGKKDLGGLKTLVAEISARIRKLSGNDRDEFIAVHGYAQAFEEWLGIEQTEGGGAHHSNITDDEEIFRKLHKLIRWFCLVSNNDFVEYSCCALLMI